MKNLTNEQLKQILIEINMQKQELELCEDKINAEIAHRYGIKMAQELQESIINFINA